MKRILGLCATFVLNLTLSSPLTALCVLSWSSQTVLTLKFLLHVARLFLSCEGDEILTFKEGKMWFTNIIQSPVVLKRFTTLGPDSGQQDVREI